jgi:hypothetical protein
VEHLQRNDGTSGVSVEVFGIYRIGPGRWRRATEQIGGMITKFRPSYEPVGDASVPVHRHVYGVVVHP